MRSSRRFSFITDPSITHDSTVAAIGRADDRRVSSAQLSALVQLADQRQGERSPHVLEMRPDLEAHAVPAWVTFDVVYGNVGLAQWPTAAHAHGRVVHVGDVLTDPAIELRLQVAALFPGADVFALDDLDVVSQATDHEDVGQLGAELVVQLRF